MLSLILLGGAIATAYKAIKSDERDSGGWWILSLVIMIILGNI